MLDLKDRRNMVKGIKIQGYHGEKANHRYCSASQNRSFRGVSSCGRDTDWVMCVNQEEDPLNETIIVNNVSPKMFHSLSLETFDLHVEIYSHFPVY